MHSIQRAFTMWGKLPGNWDPLHTSEMFGSDNEYGIPTIENNAQIPSRLIQWGSKPNLLAIEEGSNTAVHFFIDDYRFESLWKNPARNLETLIRIGCVLSPDFSLFRDMPIAMQIWNVYRNRWLGCFWQSYGIKVVPTISWSQSHDFCYYGVPQGSIVAVSSVGLRDQEARFLFREGLERMVDVLKPETILCYGNLPMDIKTDASLVTFPTRWTQRRKSARKVESYANLPLWRE